LGALRALKYFGGELTRCAQCEQFVLGCFDKESGAFADQRGGTPDVITTSIGLMALVELKLPIQEYQRPALKYLADHVKTFDEIRMAAAAIEAVHAEPASAGSWLQQVLAMQKPNGTFGKGDGISGDTGSAVATVMRLGGTVQDPKSVLTALRQGQRADGGFGKEGAGASDLETSYRVMRAFHMLREKPDVERLKAFISRCRNADGGYGMAPGQPSSASTTYFAAVITYWLAQMPSPSGTD
jgi:prenyltransferase beta subunit